METSSTAYAAHEAGSYFLYNGTLYQAVADIAAGGTITPGTNCVAVPGGLGGEMEKANGRIADLNALCMKEVVTTGSGSRNVTAGTAIPARTHLIDILIPAGDTYKFTLSASGLISKYALYENGQAARYNCVPGVEYTLTAGRDVIYLSIYCAPEDATGTGTITGSVQAIHTNSNSLEERVETLEHLVGELLAERED